MGIIGINLTHSHWVLTTRWTWLLTLLFIGLLGFVGQVIIVLFLSTHLKSLRVGHAYGQKILLTVGLQLETASRGTLALYTQIVFTVILQFLAFGTVPSMLSVVGAIVIIVSAVYVAVRAFPSIYILLFNRLFS
jgi:drug/metabolite transporter (DMT)-like permease